MYMAQQIYKTIPVLTIFFLYLRRKTGDGNSRPCLAGDANVKKMAEETWFSFCFIQKKVIKNDASNQIINVFLRVEWGQFKR